MKLKIDVVQEKTEKGVTTRLAGIRQRIEPVVREWLVEEIASFGLNNSSMAKRMQSGERVRRRLQIEIGSSNIIVLQSRIYKRTGS